MPEPVVPNAEGLREAIDALDKCEWANGEPITDYGRGYNQALDDALPVFEVWLVGERARWQADTEARDQAIYNAVARIPQHDGGERITMAQYRADVLEAIRLAVLRDAGQEGTA